MRDDRVFLFFCYMRQSLTRLALSLSLVLSRLVYTFTRTYHL
jgi:hypothetical protein